MMGLRLEKPSGVCVTYLAFKSFETVARNQSKILKKNFMAGCLGRYKILIFVQMTDALNRVFETYPHVIEGVGGIVKGVQC